MNDMTPETLRNLVSQHCGPERYRTFIESFNLKARRRARLAFWQQDVIDALAQQHPALTNATVDDLTPAFRICHVHFLRLVDCHLPANHGDVYQCRDFESALIEHFPYAPTFAMVGPDYTDSHVTLDQCPECVLAMEAYNAGRRDA